MIVLFVYLLSSILASECASFAQAQGIQGELTSDQRHEFGRYTVELRPAAGLSDSIDRVFVSQDGRFEIRDIQPGSYLAVVRDLNGVVIHQDFATVQSPGRISIRLPEYRTERPVTGLVSVHELRHKPPKTARKAYEESLRRVQRNDRAGAMVLLESAVRLDPEYVEAWNNLGAQYIRTGRYEEAAQCFRRAIALSPGTPMLHGNLAQALLFLQDYAGAESSARHAIALDGRDPMTSRAELVLALALAGKGETVSAQSLLLTCSQSEDQAVRRAAREYLSRQP